MTSGQARHKGGKSKHQKKRPTKVIDDRPTKVIDDRPSKVIDDSKGKSPHQPENSRQPLSQASQTSEYQDVSSTDLPPSSTWPTPSAVPSHLEMNYILLGLTSPHNTSSPAQFTPFRSPYAQTTHYCHYPHHKNGAVHCDVDNQRAAARMYENTTFSSSDMPSTEYGMTAMERWSKERPSQQGALLPWEGEYDGDEAGLTRRSLKRS